MQINKKNNQRYFNGSGLKVGIVVSRWHSAITEKLLADALKALHQSGLHDKNIKIVHVAGAVEIPFALHRLAKLKNYNFLVALGCIVRGETPHFDYVCKMAQEGVLKVMIEDDIPVGFGVLTMNSLAQAKKRIHVGGEAALAALELSLLK